MDIKKSDRTTLKSYFVKNAVPTASNFADLIDAMSNQRDDGIAKLAGEPLSIQADGADTSQKKAINFYKNFADPKPAWTLSLNPRVDANNAATAKPGWSIGDGDGNSKLFIDQATGNVGVGTVEPVNKLQVAGNLHMDGHSIFLRSGPTDQYDVIEWNPATDRVDIGGFNGVSIGYTSGAPGIVAPVLTAAKDNVGIGTATPTERLDINGRAKAGALTVGPWPANPSYVFLGANTLNQAAAGNYALLQGTTDGPGRTMLNSPVDIRFRIANADQMILANNGNVGIGTSTPNGKLHVQTGGAGAWDKFVVNTTNFWGDGASQYVTIGEGGAAGIMFFNPHVVWYPAENRASIRMGRSGGVSGGHWWDIGVRTGNAFSIVDGHNGAFGLSINDAGTVKINVLQLGDKWRMSGVGDGTANDDWLRLFNIQNNNYWGGFAAGKLWTQVGSLSGSDLRMKTEVSALQEAPENILKLRGVRFKWRDGAECDTHEIGLIAQEVEQVFPEVVQTGPDGMKGINYSALIAPLIEAVKQQQVQIGELRAKIGALEANG